jgi:protein-S-isoprenylcysteine O-methyltransferase Ste14
MFPEPKRRDGVVSSGPYGYARHPMYGGLLLLFGGISLARSIPALVLTAALGVLWWRKSVVEERRLIAAYPDYPAYRQRVRRRFVPFVA